MKLSSGIQNLIAVALAGGGIYLLYRQGVKVIDNQRGDDGTFNGIVNDVTEEVSDWVRSLPGLTTLDESGMGKLWLSLDYNPESLKIGFVHRDPGSQVATLYSRNGLTIKDWNGNRMAQMRGHWRTIQAVHHALNYTGVKEFTTLGVYNPNNKDGHKNGLAIDIADESSWLVHGCKELGYKFRFANREDGNWYHVENGVSVIQHKAGPGHQNHHWHVEFTPFRFGG